MSRAALVFPGLIFVAVAALLSFGALNYTWTAFAFPLGAGVILCIFCAGEVAATLTGRRKTVPAVDEERAGLSLPSIAWLFALAPLLYGLGFVAGPACYLLVCLRGNGFSWSLSASIALASVAVTWGLFIKVMGILLPVVPLWMA